MLFSGIMFVLPQNTTEVYAAGENYLTLTATGGSVSITFKCVANKSGSVSYRIGTVSNWTTYSGSSTLMQIMEMGNGIQISLTAGQCVQFIGTNVITNSSYHFSMSATTSGATVEASGDVTSLTNGTGGDATLSTGDCYLCMFYGCSILTTAPNLPSTTLISGCYKRMFENCTGLTSAPSLPATTLVANCYQNMFKGCTSLTTAPSLSATTLAESCYYEMFSGCSKLATAPNLPAETLQKLCYASMFENCIALTTAPTISVKTLAENSCQKMFKGCTNLEAPADMSKVTTLATGCCIQMYQNCTSLKMYTNNKTDGYQKAWTVPDITTASNWNENMFDGCGSDNCCSSSDPSLNTTYYVKGEGSTGGSTPSTGIYFDNSAWIITASVALVAGIVGIAVTMRKNSKNS